MARLTDEQVDTIAAYAESGRDTELLALVAECKAGRLLAAAARRISHSPEVVGHTEDAARRLFDLDQAIRAYDQATGRPDPATGHAEPEGQSNTDSEYDR